MSEVLTESTPSSAERPEQVEAVQRTFAHMWEMFFAPEIKKRQEAGTLPDGFQLWIGQMLLPPKGENLVLLNDEVRGVGLMRAQRRVEKGEPITLADLAYVEKFDLPDDLLDHGHFTIINRGEVWGIYFNFLTGRAKAKDRLVVAGQFLETSRDSAAKGHAGPAVENLFAAAELASKAELILHRSPAAHSKRHGPVASAINAWGKSGNIDRAFVSLFNKLGQERPNARYGDTESRPSAPSAEDLDLVAAVIERGLRRVTKATDR